MNKRKEKISPAGFWLAEQVLEQLPTPVMAVNKNLQVIYLNTAGRNFLGKSWKEIDGKNCYDLFKSTHCNTSDCCMKRVIEEGKPRSARNEITINGQTTPFEYFAAPLKDKEGSIIGGLEYILDITERVRYEERLREQARTIREISTPALKLWEGITILPVVGVVDSQRAQQMMEIVLSKIAETVCRVAIIDIQGVPAVDTAVANHLIKIAKAIRLMGCRPIISGISSLVAQTIVSLGIDIGATTKSTLSDALLEAFTIINCEVHPSKGILRGSL